ECRAELDSLAGAARLLPLADPEHFGTAPAPPPALADRVAASIRAERRTSRRRLRRRLAFSGATAAVAAAALAIFVLPGGSGAGPEQHIAFQALPPGLHIGATLGRHAYGTEFTTSGRG